MKARAADGSTGYWLEPETYQAVGEMIRELLELRAWKRAVLKSLNGKRGPGAPEPRRF